MDMAALGIPVIGSNRNQTNRLLWPELTVDPVKETGATLLLAQRLVENKAYYLAQVQCAHKALNGFAPEIAKKRLLDIIKEFKK